MKMKKTLFLMILLCLLPSTLMAEEYKEGVHYSSFLKQFPVSTGDKIEVREVFWYGCPHCFNLEGPLHKWRQEEMPANAEFVRMPGIFRDSWIPHARAYYAFDALGQTEKLHHAMMKAMHVDKQRLMTKEQITNFIVSQGINRKEFLDAYNSFSVDSLSRQAAIMTKRYGISGVPSLIVDGRYLVSSSHSGKGELFKVVNHLVQKAADLRNRKKTEAK